MKEVEVAEGIKPLYIKSYFHYSCYILALPSSIYFLVRLLMDLGSVLFLVSLALTIEGIRSLDLLFDLYLTF